MEPKSVVAMCLLIVLAGCTPEEHQADAGKEESKPMSIQLTSSAFAEGAPIPKTFAYTGEGDNVSPALSWTGVPPNTQELALICDDPDAPTQEPWVHWVLYGIPASAHGLAEGDTGGATPGTNSWNELGWGGPKPPPGHGPHHYYFRLYALDKKLELPQGATKRELLDAIEDHVLAEGRLMGTYERR